MKIHNYGNDYVQSTKFKKVDNAGNTVANDEPTASEEVRAETAQPQEEAKAEKASRKKKQDNSDNV